MATYRLLIYQNTDFTGGLPDENGSGHAASGVPVMLTLSAAAAPVEIVVIDDQDADLGDVVGATTQRLAAPVTINGVSYAAGDNVVTAYDLIDSVSGLQITSIHIGPGFDGNSAGPVHGAVATAELVPGASYDFDVERTSNGQPNAYARFVCFHAGTLIAAPGGARPVESLAVGDLVETLDRGPRPVRWIARSRLGAEELATRPAGRPVRIAAGALGAGRPERALLVSAQHRVLLRSRLAAALCGSEEALAAATHLAGLPGVTREEGAQAADYVHLLMDRHELVLAEGAAAETFLPGPHALAALSPRARAQVCAILPPPRPGGRPPSARPILSGAATREIVRRHLRLGRGVQEG